MHLFTKHELQVIEYLKNHTIIETAAHFGVHRGSVDYLLWNARNKIEKGDGTHSLGAVWKDSKRNPRLAKLLRRQEPTQEDEADEEG